MKKPRGSYFIIFSVLLVSVFLSIGYSAFHEEMLIDDIGVTVRLHEDLRVTGVSVDSATNGGFSVYEDYNVHNALSGIYLPYEDSTITFKIEITNFGNVEKGIFDLWLTPNNLTFELKECEYKEKICDSSGNCKLGTKKDIYITISYQWRGYNKSKVYYDINLDFDFRKYYQVSYVNIDTSNGHFPAEIMDGDSGTIIFNDGIPKNISVIMDGKPYTDYMILKNDLIIPEVTGDIVITNIGE